MRHSRRQNRYKRYQGSKGHYRKFRNQVDSLAATGTIYRSRQGIFMGVCRGVAEHFDISVFWVRGLVVMAFLFSGFWPMGVLYIIAGLLLKLEPVMTLESGENQDFYDSDTASRTAAIQKIKGKFDNINRRIQRMEDTVTSRDFEF